MTLINGPKTGRCRRQRQQGSYSAGAGNKEDRFAMIAIVDYGMGNLLSVFHALEMIGSEPKICTSPEELREAERIILPGVGAFRDCIHNLRAKGFAEALNREVI